LAGAVSQVNNNDAKETIGDQHNYQVVMMSTGTSLAELLLCHLMLGHCGLLTVIHQLNPAFETVWQTIHIAGIMNRTA